ncbi:hypothetical protein WKT02_12320 [Erysipelotrichaceae bacterium HCN-30851]
MKKTVRLQEEISKNVSARKHTTTTIEYFCDTEEDTKVLTHNITEVLTKHLGDANLAKITYDYHPAEKKVEVVIVEH